MFKILMLNRIASEGLGRLPQERYEVASEFPQPDAILVRSQDMHDMDVPESLLAVGRAGAGVNNIPIDALAQNGIPVFNAPGANANAVKELVLAGLLMAARNLGPAWNYVRELDGQDKDLKKKVEDGKKRFVGGELPGRTLGVLGLGAVGVKVANAALALGMEVLGFDPAMTVENAWQLSSGVKKVASPGELFARSDAVTLHVPLIEATRGMVNAERLALLKPNGVLLNFARGEIVDEKAALDALAEGRLGTYVTDFPTLGLKDHPQVVALPHLGASTKEAEANCAIMAVDQLMDYLENGTIRNAVNFPSAELPPTRGHRLSVINRNVPNMVGQVSSCLGEHGHNIRDLLNQSKGDVGYTLVDVESEVDKKTLDKVRAIEGVLKVRRLS